MTGTLYLSTDLRDSIYTLLDNAGHGGLTCAEVRDRLDVHHGAVSGAMAVLHRDLKIARLTEKREGYKVYVHPDFLDGRKAEAQGSGSYSKQEIEEAMALKDFIDEWLTVEQTGARIVTHLTKAERFKPLFFAQLKRMRDVT